MKPATLAEALTEICALQDASIGQRLAAYCEALQDLKSPFTPEYDRLVERLAMGKIGADAPLVGTPMPRFVLPDSTGRLVSLDELCAAGPLVISFNRGHWCSFCKIELAALADAHAVFAERGARVVSIMPERQHFTRALQEKFAQRLLFLSDIDNGYALTLGLAMWLGETIRAMMAERGERLDEFQGNEAWFVPLPATFVVGADGIVKARFIDPNFRKRMDIADMLDALPPA